MITPQSVITDNVMLEAISNSYGVYTRLALLLGTTVGDAKRRVKSKLKYQNAFKTAALLQSDLVMNNLLALIEDGNVKAIQIYYDHLGSGGDGDVTVSVPVTLIEIGKKTHNAK